MRWVPSEPMRFTVAPPVSPYTGPGQSTRSRQPPLGPQVGVYSFSLRVFPQVLHGDRSLFYACLSLKCPVVQTHAVTSARIAFGFTPHTSRTLLIALADGHDNMFLRHPAIDTVWRWPCLPRF